MCVCVCVKGNIYIYMHIHVRGDIRVSVCEPVGERGISVECVSSGLLATRRALKGTSVKIWHCGISFICNKQLITLRGTRSHTHTHTHTTSVHFQRTSTWQTSRWFAALLYFESAHLLSEWHVKGSFIFFNSFVPELTRIIRTHHLGWKTKTLLHVGKYVYGCWFWSCRLFRCLNIKMRKFVLLKETWRVIKIWRVGQEINSTLFIWWLHLSLTSIQDIKDVKCSILTLKCLKFKYCTIFYCCVLRLSQFSSIMFEPTENIRLMFICRWYMRAMNKKCLNVT